MKTFRRIVHQSFRDACLARCLLANDNLWSDTMQELVLTATPSKIRKTFSFILIHGDPNNPAGLWETFSESMIEDFGRNQPEAEALQRALADIQRILQQFGKCLNDFGLPALEQAAAIDLPNILEMRNAAQELRPMLNQGQLAVADSVLEALQNNNLIAAKVFFLDGPGGTGKTFVYNYIIREAISRGKHVSIFSQSSRLFEISLRL